jgi:hypothetical protein
MVRRACRDGRWMDQQKIYKASVYVHGHLSGHAHIGKNWMEFYRRCSMEAYIQLALHQIIPATKLKYLIILLLIYLGSSQQEIDLSTDHYRSTSSSSTTSR